MGAIASTTATVTTAGTRVPISATALPVCYAIIQAKTGNTGVVYVGGPTVSSANGIKLLQGGSVTLPALPYDGHNLANTYVDADNNNDGVTVLYGQQ